MTKRVGQALFSTLALIALAVGDIDLANATSDNKPAAKVVEPAVAKFPSAQPAVAPQTARADEPVVQAKPSRPIAPQTPPPARTARPGSPLPPGPVAIVTIPPSTPPAPKGETKPEPVKQVSAAARPAAKLGQKNAHQKAEPKKPEAKKLVQARPAR